jgi:hypothetical protein
MKKGLLSLLAVALTIVSCQNYDDQFAELTDLVNTLSTDVEGLTQVQSDLASLSATVNGLATSSTALATDLAATQAAIDMLSSQLGNASEDDLPSITEALAELQADVRELLEANAVINQSITISNLATLEFVETLISTGTSDPNVIVNGSVTIESTFANSSAAYNTRINALTNKISTILGNTNTGVGLNVTSSASSTVSFNELTFIDNSLTESGYTFSHPKLTTITGDITIAHSGAADYSVLTTGGNISLSSALTSVDFGSATIKSISTTGSGTGIISLPKATKFVAGTAQATTVIVPKATVVTFGAAKQTTAVVTATAENSVITVNSKEITGALTINGHSGSTFSAPNLVNPWATTIGAIASADFPKVTEFKGNSTIAAKTVSTPELAKTVSGTLNITVAEVFNAPKLVTAMTVTASKAITVNVKSSKVSALVLPVVKTLTLEGQGTTTDFNTAGYAALESFTITGAQGKAPFISTVTNTIWITGSKLKTVNIAGGDIDTATVSGTEDLTSLTTAGEIKSFTLNDADKLVSATIGHAHLEGSDAADFTVTGNDELASLTTTALDETGDIDISGNAKLASLDLSSLQTIPLLGTYTINIQNNKLTGDYVEVTAGSTTTVTSEGQVKSNDLNTLTAYLQKAVDSRASATTGNVTYTLTINLSDADPSKDGAQDLQTLIGMDPAANMAPSIVATGTLLDSVFVKIVKAE